MSPEEARSKVWKLVALANDNSNDDESDVAARAACKLIARYKLLDAKGSRVAEILGGVLDEDGKEAVESVIDLFDGLRDAGIRERLGRVVSGYRRVAAPRRPRRE